MATTINAKYVFLDIVGFTTRNVEAQAEVVQALNRIVAASVATLSLPRDKLIFIPTGDGICITLLSGELSFDAHIRAALDIIRAVHEHNSGATKETRKFKVRVGINSNTDNLITDINGNQNIAGAGINMASRIMDLADGNQILVGESVFDTLRDREDYEETAFKKFTKKVKHDRELTVYQLIKNGHDGLNTEVPFAFQDEEPKLARTVAYYLAHAIRHQSFLLSKLERAEAATGIIVLWFLALSACRRSHATEIPTIYTVEDDYIEGRFAYYDDRLDRDVRHLLSELICREHLQQHQANFEPTVRPNYLLVSERGQRKLAAEWRNIWDEFELYRHA